MPDLRAQPVTADGTSVLLGESNLLALAHGRLWHVAGNISGQSRASVQDDTHAPSLALTAIPPIGQPWESTRESETLGQWFLLHSSSDTFVLGWYLAPCVAEGGQHWFSIVFFAEATAAFQASLARPNGKSWLMHDRSDCFVRSLQRRPARVCFRLTTLQAYRPEGLRDLQRQVVLHKYNELAQSSHPNQVARRRVLLLRA